MSREIKFRAWDKKEKAMASVENLNFEFNMANLHFSHDYFKDNIDLSEVELMQFAGVKDYNGQEIYEGDIVEFLAWDLYYDDNGEVKEIKQVRKKDKVIFKDGKFMAYSTNLSELIKVEVVGNIYQRRSLAEQNSELLK